MVGGRCLFLECRKRSISPSGRGISLHGFPREPSQFAQWENWVREACGMTNFVYYPATSVLCSRHFPENSLCFSRNGIRLRKNAVPSITSEDLNAAETLGLRLNPDFPLTESGEAQRSHFPIMTEGASSPTLNSSGDTDKAAKSPQPKTSSGECNDAQKVILEAQDNGGGPSHPTPRPRTKQKFAIDLSPDYHNSYARAEKHLNILRNALTSTRSRLSAQSCRILRVKKSVLKIQKLVQNLKEETLVADKGQLELDIAVNNILDHLNCEK